MPDVTGYHHAAFSVNDLERSARWYEEILGFTTLWKGEIMGRGKLIMRHPTGAILGFTHHGDNASGDAFDETRTGLDHIAFGVPDRAAMEEWVAFFDEHGVEHGEIGPSLQGDYLAFRDPDNIQLELYTLPPR